MSQLYRIQDDQGRGPWRPGFSHKWVDMEKDDSLCPPMMFEFPDWKKAFKNAQKKGRFHFGCCAIGVKGLHQWFTPVEMNRLRLFGFHLTDASRFEPILQSPNQAIIASAFPLALLPRISWEMAS